MRSCYLILLMALLFLLPEGAHAIIHGKVTNEAGKPFPGVRVLLLKAGSEAESLTTNQAGTFSFSHLAEGTYSAIFSAKGYESIRYRNIRVKGNDQVLILDVQLAKSTNQGNTTTTRNYVPASLNGARRTTRYAMKPVEVEASYAKDESKRTGEIYRSVAPTYDAATPVSPSKAAIAEETRSVHGGDHLVDGGVSTSGTTFIVEHPALAAHSGMLTSGEVNDFSKWTLWQDLSMDALKAYHITWQFRPEARYTVQIKSNNGMPLCNAHIKLSDGSHKIWEAITDNTGKAELWYGMWDTTASTKGQRLSASVDYNKQHYNIANLKPFAEGLNILPTQLACLNPAKLDIAFIVDATGSMQDEIDYLKAELRDILQQVKDSLPAIQVRTGAVFYRDLTDEYITRSSDLTHDFNKTEAFIASNNAGGGGDMPEAVDEALEDGLASLNWSADATARLAFLVLDAPPHEDAATIKHMQLLAAQYAARGIRLIPVVCSGADKSTEYLMRSLALVTNGTYLFLTSHSGIGGSHLSPTTDKYDVEYLNGLIYRVIYNCSYMPACNNQVVAGADTLHVDQPIQDSASISWSYYPNPTFGILHIVHSHTHGYLFVTDITGKAIVRIAADASGTTTIDLTQYPSGMYAIRYNWEGDQWVTGKFVVVH